MGRTEKATKNIAWSIFGKLITLAVNFLVRTVFILVLDKTLLGVNGLYTEILGLLSFAELGFGTAMNFAMYKPMAEGNEEKIYALLKFYKKVYRIIAVTVLAIGLALLPFLGHLIKGAERISPQELKIYYVFFLVNSVSSYFLSYKTAYVNAAQKNYIATNYETICKVATTMLQVLVLWIFKDYLAFLIAQIVVSISSKVIFSIYLDRRFAIFTKKMEVRLSKEDKGHIFAEVKALVVHQLSSVAIYSTDNIIMSSIQKIGVVVVGLVSNYTLIINSITAFAQLIFVNMSSSFGNLAASDNKKHMRHVFNQIELVGFWIYGFVSICLYVLLPPFIQLWIGTDYLVDGPSFLLIILNCYLMGQTTVYYHVRIVKGDFFRDKWLALLQMLINLVVSIVAARIFGLAGIYIGTVASRIFFAVGRPLLTYRFIFGQSVWHYYKRTSIHLCCVLLTGAIAKLLCGFILSEVDVWRFAIAAVVCAAISGGILFVSVVKTKEFAELMSKIKGVIRNVRAK
ncbi:MAG: hypothetical protein E7467_01805 [Ruminococcaceae bacterium]|nr:hypothetical protein [Oscillospiraceae bacterium]